MPGAVGLVQFEAGQSLTAPEFRERLNAIAEQAADGTQLSVGPGLIHAYSPGIGHTIAIDVEAVNRPTERLFAMITGNSSGALYTWTERVFNGSAWIEPDEPLSSDDEGNAFEVQARAGVPDGTIVELIPVIRSDGASGYVFDLGLGTRQDAAGTLLDEAVLDPGDLTSEIPNEDTWDVSSQGETRGVKVSLLTRVVYDDEGSQILYQYSRVFTFDANGHLTHIDVEVPSEVTTPIDCEEA